MAELNDAPGVFDIKRAVSAPPCGSVAPSTAPRCALNPESAMSPHVALSLFPVGCRAEGAGTPWPPGNRHARRTVRPRRIEDLAHPPDLTRRNGMARRSPPRKVTYFEPVPPRLAGNNIIESTFEVGRRFRCTMRVDCSQLDARRGDPVGTRRMAPAYARAPRRKRSLRTGALAAMRSIGSPP